MTWAAAFTASALAPGTAPAQVSAPDAAAPDTSTAPALPELTVLDARASPQRAFFAGRPVAITFGLRAPAPLALQVDVVRDATNRPVRRFVLPAAAPGVAQRVEWDGLTGGDKVAPSGAYRIRIRAADGRVRRGGRFVLRSHIYPVRGRHVDRGPAGAFGVGRNGGRTHQGFDVNAACGTTLVAARGGRVVRSDHDPVLYGHVVIIRGERTTRDYWYSHLQRRSPLRVGDRVRTGARIGAVGATGNARTVGCHLHFEIRSRGVPIDPAPELRAWDAWDG
ncbi:MAG: peptidoglycan DD-metalloendopeptidase family protein [Solirubrobacteraceae bacterium]|nr:peptidoglycan DD-metalloendopeptidase family protein [Solirubrobacteraceae bacterium]